MRKRRFFIPICIVLLLLFGGMHACAEGSEIAPKEYFDFLDSLPDEVLEGLPENASSNQVEDIHKAAEAIITPTYFLKTVFDAFGSNLASVAPSLALLCGIVMLSATVKTLSASLGGVGRTAEISVRLCSFCSIATLSVSSLGRLDEYFSSLFEAVSAFLPLSAALYAMGGNLTSAANSLVSLNTTLSVCQFLIAKSAIPVFCLCLSFTLLSVFDGFGANVGAKASASIKKWYVTFFSFVMMILTVTIASQSILSSKADGAAMRGAKFAVSSFVPLSGGTLSGTLGTLASSVELMRSSVGVVGVSVIILLIIPVVIELALLRGVFGIAAFISGITGCTGEERLISEIGSLYGYLEGVAVLCGAVFLIAFAVFAASVTPFS